MTNDTRVTSDSNRSMISPSSPGMVMKFQRSVSLSGILSLTLGLGGCTATQAMVSLHQANGSLQFEQAEPGAPVTLTSERREARIVVAAVEDDGVDVTVESRAVCPQVTPWTDRYRASRPPRVSRLAIAAIADVALGTGAWFQVARWSGTQAAFSPANVDMYRYGAIAGTVGMVGAGAAMWVLPRRAVEQEAPRTEWIDDWCGDWQPEREGWTVSYALRSWSPNDSMPANWVATASEAEARSAQLPVALQAGLRRRVGVATSSVEFEPIPARLHAGDPAARVEGAAEGSGATRAEGVGARWRIHPAALAERGWETLRAQAQRAPVSAEALTLAVFARSDAHALDGGATRVDVTSAMIEAHASAWACATASERSVHESLLRDNDTVLARVLTSTRACADALAPVHTQLCTRTAERAMQATGALPAPADLAPVLERCGSEAWGPAAWKVLGGRIEARDWAGATSILNDHGTLLASVRPVSEGERMTIEGRILEAVTAATAATKRDGTGIANPSGALTALTTLAEILPVHAQRFPQQATWAAPQRAAAITAATALVRARLDAERFDDADAAIQTGGLFAGMGWSAPLAAESRSRRAVVEARRRAEEARAAAERRAYEAEHGPSWCRTRQYGSSNYTCADMFKSARQWCAMTGRLCDRTGMLAYIHNSYGIYDCDVCR